MKQSSFLLLLPLFVLAFFPKNAAAQVRYGLKTGAQLVETDFQGQFQTGPTSPPLAIVSTAPLLTFFAGAQAEYETSKNLALSAGLQVSGGGGTVRYADAFDRVSVETRYSLLYAQLPVMARAQHRGFSLGVGLYAGLGLWGRKKMTTDLGNGPKVDRSDIQFGTSEDTDYARFDWGALAEAGYSFRNFRVAAHYWLGLSNVLPEYYRSNGDKWQNRAYGASLTYFLGEGE